MAKTDKTEQNVLNELYGTLATFHSSQEIANLVAGNAKTTFSLQEVLNIKKGNDVKTIQSAQAILYENVGQMVSLTGGATAYSEQELLNIAIENNLTVQDVILGLQTYIKSLSGLVAYYPLNETSGTVATNRAPTTLGTLDGTTSGATVGVAGKVGRAYSFDGVNDRIDLQNGNTVKNLAACSIGALVNVKAGIVDRRIYQELVNDSGDSSRLSLRLLSTEKFDLVARTGAAADTARIVVTPDAYADGWYSVVATVDIEDDAMKIFVNGVDTAATGDSTFAGTAFADTDPNQVPLIGCGYTGAGTYSNFFDSLLQHKFVVNRLMTATEILKLARIANVI